MPFIVKTSPIAAEVGDTVEIEERPMYGGEDIDTGDTVFLWVSEQQGGHGLWARGTVLHVLPAGNKLSIEVRIAQLAPVGNFGIDQIAPHRDSSAATPIVGLAHKLYKHAHNKIAGVTNAEADLLLHNFQ